MTTSKDEFAVFINDQLQVLGPVDCKRMFGGYGYFLGGLMFALIADNLLYLKVDDENRKAFEEMGLEPFTYQKKDKTFSMSYYQAPDVVYEDIEAMHTWGNSAYSAALRQSLKKSSRKKTNKKQR